MVFAKGQLHIAALRHLHCFGDGLGAVSKGSFHLLRRLEIELVGGKAEAAGVVDGLAGLDAEEHLVGLGLLAIQVMAVVGGDERDGKLPGKLLEAPVDDGLFRDVVLLHLKVEAVAEELDQPFRLLPRPLHVALGDVVGNGAVQAGGERDQACAVGGQHLHVDAWLVVEAFDLGDGGELHEVLVAGAIHGEQDQVESGLARALGRLVEAVVGGDVELAADDGLDPSLLRLDIELESAIHGAVVGDGHALHAVFLALGEQIADPDGPVEQAVLGVDMEVDEIGGCCIGHGLSSRRMVDAKARRRNKEND